MKRAQAQVIIREFEAAHDRYLFRSVEDPDDRKHLEQRYKVLRERLLMRLVASPIASIQRDGPAQ